MNDRALLLLILSTAAIACETKSVPQPASPPSSQASQANQAPPSSSGAASSAPSSSATPAPSADAMRAEILQKTLEIDSLATYWHDKSSPLQIASSDVVGLPSDPPAARPSLTMFGKPVVYIAAPTPAMTGKRGSCTETKDPSACAFRFTSLSVSGTGSKTAAAVDFVLPREGVSGHVDFERDPKGNWIVKKKSVVEH